MDIIILKNDSDVAYLGANMIMRQIKDFPQTVLGLASGATPVKMYKCLAQACRSGKLSFSRVTSFNLDEYVGLEYNSPLGYRFYMQKMLFDNIDIKPENTYFPSCPGGNDPRKVAPEYERLIARAGGIDLQILGVGDNGHIAFNEPGSSLVSRSRMMSLSKSTLAQDSNSHMESGMAITMGVGTIMEARQIVLLATGPHKAQAVEAALEGPVSTLCPASVLQFHKNVTVLLDEAAAANLQLADYYKMQYQEKIRLDRYWGEIRKHVEALVRHVAA